MQNHPESDAYLAKRQLRTGSAGWLLLAVAPANALGVAAFALMLPLAATSNDAAVRRLKQGWKRLQRLAYPAALLTFAHWVWVHDGLQEALLYCTPLALLQIIRIISQQRAARRLADI